MVYDHVLFLMFGAMDIDCIYLLGHMIYHTFDHGTIYLFTNLKIAETYTKYT